MLRRARPRTVPWRAPSLARNVSAPAARYETASSTPEESEGSEELRERARSAQGTAKDVTFAQWLSAQGRQFDKPHRSRNWLAEGTPFPLNPSFKPPTPVSDALKTTIYKQYMANPEANSIRQLAGRYHLSMKRVDAILRLKGLENHWREGKPLQTGFQKGMEFSLGVEDDADRFKSHEDWVESRMKSVEADALDQVQGDDMARARYQHMFWEPVVEGEKPVVLAALERARAASASRKLRFEAGKSDDKLLGHHHDKSQAREVVNQSGSAPGRPLMTFVDVGGKFLDPRDRERRMKGAERRSNVKSRRKASTRTVTA